tara:strand:- start:1008 stop:1655 length:648 start_codon:yes stop_codon:yes gene_type:complete
MIKPTKRKAFNFLRSYFDVFNELETDADKLDFLTSIINKQFLNEDPKELNFIVNLCYESQRHQIESSVKGWVRANKDTPITDPPTNPPLDPSTNPKEEEEKEEEKEKEKEECIYHTHESFLLWFKECREYLGLKYNVKRLTTLEKQSFNELKNDYTKEDFKIAFKNFSDDKFWNDPKKNMLMPKHFLNPEHFTKYLNAEVKKELTVGQKLMGGIE